MAARTCSPWVVLVALTGLVASAATLAAGCVSGTTPDCSSPEAGCGPGAEGGPLQPDSSLDAPADVTLVDAGADTGVDSGQDSGQSGIDASDAASEASDASDASTVDADATTD